MEKEVLVYVDLGGTPHLVGRLWTHFRKDRESASFRIRQELARASGAFLPRARIESSGRGLITQLPEGRSSALSATLLRIDGVAY